MTHWDKEHLNNRKRKDDIKNKYCFDNGIELFRIKYDENIIEKINTIIGV